MILHISKICALVLSNLFNLSRKKRFYALQALCFHFSSTGLINTIKHDNSGKIFLFFNIAAIFFSQDFEVFMPAVHLLGQIMY